MASIDRLLSLIAILRDGQTHRANDLARKCTVSIRTIYRDMDRLVASGVPVQGRPGTGYWLEDRRVLPPLSLTTGELDALNIGIAIVSEAADPSLKSAALSLSAKIDAALPEDSVAEADAWKYALTPLADTARGLSHIASIRSAIRGKQKLRLSLLVPGAAAELHVIRPLRLESWGRVWTLTGWSETNATFCDMRLDLIETVTPLPELFIDEIGKRLSDR